MFDLGIIKQTKLPCSVISVGNITVGGTGKTPMVITLANMLRSKGYRPAVLSRGYGGDRKTPLTVVSDGEQIITGYAQAGDEPVLIARSTPGVAVLTGPDRTQTGNYAIKELGADILILDDAFQHRHIFRDVDIVLLNREKPLGNGHLLPRGPLRESPKALNRAHILIWKDTVLNGRFPRYQEQGIGVYLPVLSAYPRAKALVQANTGEVLPVENLREKKVCGFAGIAFPEAFRQTIESIGGVVVSFLPFPDHHRYTESDLSRIERVSADSSAEIVLTTEKDAIRLTDFPDFRKHVFILRVVMEILPSPGELEKVLFRKLQ